MANPFKQALDGSQPQQRGQRNFAPALLQHIQNFHGNPVEILRGKINSGEISAEQYNQMRGIAENIVGRMMSVLPRR